MYPTFLQLCALRHRCHQRERLTALFTLPMLLLSYLCVLISPAPTASIEPMEVLSNTLWWQRLFYSIPGLLLTTFVFFVRYAERNSYVTILLTQTCDMPRGNSITSHSATPSWQRSLRRYPEGATALCQQTRMSSYGITWKC